MFFLENKLVNFKRSLNMYIQFYLRIVCFCKENILQRKFKKMKMKSI